jgi:mannosyl-3-phosphoglycerate phosphatase
VDVTDSPFLVVITDLDGSLLDEDTYSSDAARDALDMLARAGFPVIACSSKTHAEIVDLQRELGIGHPFICENGGALVIPDEYFPMAPRGARRVAGGVALEFGSPYQDVVDALHHTAASLRATVVGFADMTVDEIAHVCDLSPERARLAKLREYDEPFRLVDATPGVGTRLRAALHVRGFRCTRGGRFDHVTGGTDKGVPLATLKTLYERYVAQPVLTVGLGDCLNDVALLAGVDLPIIVRNRITAVTSRMLAMVPAARVTRVPGAAGWGEAIVEVLDAVRPSVPGTWQ